MLPDRFAALVNLAGFLSALALYAMLLVMVVRQPHAAMASRPAAPGPRAAARGPVRRHELLLILTAVLGIVWNLGALGLYGLADFGVPTPAAFAAFAFTALGFLPAVVVHSALRSALTERRDRTARAIVASGYLVSAAAGILHIAAPPAGQTLPSPAALWLLVSGFAAIVVLLIAGSSREMHARGALSLAALAVFAVSAVHLVTHEALDSWPVELVGHHASLPLALAILYQDYPFALADIFLKRALVVVAAFAVALAVYAGAAAWLVPAGSDPLATIGYVGLGVAMAIAYPRIRRGIHWFVDAVMLRRPDYVALRARIGQSVSSAETPEEALIGACSLLGPALAARQWRCWRLEAAGSAPIEGCCSCGAPAAVEPVSEAQAAWHMSNHVDLAHADAKKTCAVAIIPTTEAPRFAFTIGDLAGGRRLLSDDLAMLSATAEAVARSIDRIRLARERAGQRLREAEIRQLATEAELRALRAQINPHFLFNALTTVGYLIQTSPGVALEKLVQLTELLRRVLRSEGDFTTLGKELEMVRLYLDLERARFEERLKVVFDAPESLLDIAVPALLVQPLVENAIKHGIAPAAAGGVVEIRAAMEPPTDSSAAPRLRITVRNTGRGRTGLVDAASGIGLRNVRERLRHHFGDQAIFHFESGERETTVTLGIPMKGGQPYEITMEAEAL